MSDEVTQPEPTGIEGAAKVFSGAAFASIALSLAMLRFGWLTEIDAIRFFFLGLEFAAAAITTATVALALGPVRGIHARPAWIAGGSALGLVAISVAWMIPRILEWLGP